MKEEIEYSVLKGKTERKELSEMVVESQCEGVNMERAITKVLLKNSHENLLPQRVVKMYTYIRSLNGVTI